MDDDLTQLALLDDEAIMLDAAALQLAALDHPDVSLDPYVDVLGEITERLVRVGGSAASAGERAAALARVLAVEHGFAGDRETYDDPDNADLVRVMDRRRGLPVALAILYVAAARRLGWSADALNTPGHVLVRIGSTIEPMLVDPFNGGAPVSAEEFTSFLSQTLGSDSPPTSEHLAAMSNRAVLVRLLMNQATRAEHAGKGERALTLYTRMTGIAPSNSHLWWERARLELVRGDVSDARASLSAMLEVTRDPGLRAHVFAALDALSGHRP